MPLRNPWRLANDQGPIKPPEVSLVEERAALARPIIFSFSWGLDGVHRVGGVQKDDGGSSSDEMQSSATEGAECEQAV